MPAEIRARRYQRMRRKLTLFDLFFRPVLLGWFAFSAMPEWLDAGAALAVPVEWLRPGGFFLLFSLCWLVYELPLAFYLGHRHEKKYKLSTRTAGAWFEEWVKKALLSFFIALLLVQGLYFLMARFPAGWWLPAWGAWLSFTIVFGMIFPVAVLPLFYRLAPLEKGPLRSRILATAAAHGFHAGDVYVMNLSKATRKANAAFMGIGKTRRIVLGDTLVRNFTEDEIEAVMLHELGHFRHRDLLRGVLLSGFLALAGFYLLSVLLPVLAAARGISPVSDPRTMPLLFLAGLLFQLAVVPAVNAHSRRREWEADRYALDSGTPTQVFVECMQKLGNLNLADPAPGPVYEWYFYDHPSIRNRIRYARSRAGGPA